MSHPTYLNTTRRRFLGGTAAASAFALGARAHAQDVPPLEQYSPEYLNAAEWAFVMAATARIIPSDGDGPGAIETRVPVFIDLQLAGDFGNAADLYMEGPFRPDAPDTLGPQSPLTPAEIYRGAIEAIDTACTDEYGSVFADLDPTQQDEVLSALEESPSTSGSTQDMAEDSGGGAMNTGGSTAFGLAPELKEFFALLVQNTKEGYFADPMYGGNAGMAAWSYIGFPGARGSYAEWVGREEDYPLGPVSISGERA
ncbi:gluconate 2-dehydrogenase subunit 3 family protein [Celeribacter indicus]|uniref:gluconate 2-dehydrogenase subunit 3 family protein n=1 Tax=Celeribacter indicus TaxID=1208324 RepID=UPI0005C32BFA|nr:gluconate 2-dehydrogenase subunit 3 family protein [Celeribacter indicus]SDW89839.1 gluconate 2-dehydrogenase gamma chain [Celeribacter indicus]